MKLCWILCSAIIAGQLLSAQSEEGKKSAEDSHLRGYSSQDSQQQKDWEKKFRDGIVPDNIRENMRRLSALASSRGIALRQGQCGMDPCQVQSNMVGMRTSRPSAYCFPLLKSAWSNWWGRRNSPLSCRSRRFQLIPLRVRPRNNFLPITRIQSMATLPPHWST